VTPEEKRKRAAVKKELDAGRGPKAVAKRTGYTVAEVRKAARRLGRR
jgi:hypothetical protein